MDCFGLLPRRPFFGFFFAQEHGHISASGVSGAPSTRSLTRALQPFLENTCPTNLELNCICKCCMPCRQTKYRTLALFSSSSSGRSVHCSFSSQSFSTAAAGLTSKLLNPSSTVPPPLGFLVTGGPVVGKRSPPQYFHECNHLRIHSHIQAALAFVFGTLMSTPVLSRAFMTPT